MIKRRPFSSLDGIGNDWFRNKLHVDCYRTAGDGGDVDGPLLLWNDDLFAPRSGFPQHLHQDVEILTYLLQGAITHEDSTGIKGRTTPRKVRLMSAGSGILHSDFNAGPVPAHLFQIWLKPRSKGTVPRWAQRALPRRQSSCKMTPLASGHSEDVSGGALFTDSDARVLWASMKAGDRIIHPLYGLRAYLVPTTGEVTLSGHLIAPRDGACVVDERQLDIRAVADTEILMVELP